MTKNRRRYSAFAAALVTGLLGCKGEAPSHASETSAASVINAASAPTGSGAGASAQGFVAAFMSYVDRHHRAPGQAGEPEKRPDCHKESENPACEHGRIENGVSLRARWRPTAPATVRLFTGEPYRGKLGLKCAALHPQAEEIQSWVAESVSRLHCAVPRKQGDAIWVLVEEGADGTRLSAFYAQHLAWDTAFAARAFAGAPKPPALPDMPPQPTTSASALP